MVYLMTKNGYVGDVFQALLTALSDQNMKNELRHNESLTVKAFSSLLWCAIIFKLDNATKRLYEQGYQREDIINLFKFIDWLMSLPTELEQEFQQELNQYEEEKRMPYITSVERMGMEKGMRESVIDALEIRFENVPSELVNKISQIQDTSLLKNLLRQAITLDSISDFQGYLNQLIKPE